MNIETPKPQDQELQQHLAAVTKEITQQLEDYKIGLAAETLYNEFWHWFCDLAIEHAKTDQISLAALEKTLEELLKLLHPFVPFVTEAVWQEIHTNQKRSAELLITTPWPM